MLSNHRLDLNNLSVAAVLFWCDFVSKCTFSKDLSALHVAPMVIWEINPERGEII